MWHEEWKRRKQGCYGQTGSDRLIYEHLFLLLCVTALDYRANTELFLLAFITAQLICICPLWFPQLNYFTLTLYLNKHVSTDRMDLLCVNTGKSREFSKDPPT